MGRFDGKTAVVTGAGGEIGREISVRLARDGARVLVVDLDPARVDATVAAVEQEGDGSRPRRRRHRCRRGRRLRRRGSATRQRAHRPVREQRRRGGPRRRDRRLPDSAFDQVIAVNVRGVFLGLKHVLPRMERGASVVNTASTAGLIGAGGLVAYIASKHAVIGITRTAALECAARGIRVNAVCPGPVEGRMMTSLEEGLGGAAAHEAFLASLPLGRFGRLPEVAAMVAFLLSDEAGFSTGGRFVLDGGQTVG